MRAWSYWPQPSFWLTHMISEGELRCWSMIARYSASHWVRAAADGALSAVHGRHVLPHQQPQTVRPVEPALRLDLDVLADHVEAEVLVLLQVVPEGRVGGRGVEAVRPVALVQGAGLEDERPVEHGALDTVRPSAPRWTACPRSCRPVSAPALPVEQFGRDVVQERVLRRPQTGVRHRYGECPADRIRSTTADLCAAVGDGDLDARAVGPGRAAPSPAGCCPGGSGPCRAG